jgi:hypothetical protein
MLRYFVAKITLLFIIHKKKYLFFREMRLFNKTYTLAYNSKKSASSINTL